MTRIKQWALFAASIINMGLWFLVAPFRKDERGWFRENFELDSRLGVPGDGKDSMEEAWASLRTASLIRLPHYLNNILHEWTRENPKRAAKFLSFLVVVEAIALVLK